MKLLRRVVLVRADVSEERIASIIGVTRIGELGTMLTVTKNRSTLRRNIILRKVLQLLVTTNFPRSLILVTLMMEAIRSSEASVLTRATRRNIPGNFILYSHPFENFKFYTMFS
jgi:hypothetical protein